MTANSFMFFFRRNFCIQSLKRAKDGLQLTFVCENQNGFHAVCGDYVHTIDQKEFFRTLLKYNTIGLSDDNS